MVESDSNIQCLCWMSTSAQEWRQVIAETEERYPGRQVYRAVREDVKC